MPGSWAALRVQLLEIPLDEIVLGDFGERFIVGFRRHEIAFAFKWPEIDLTNKLNGVQRFRLCKFGFDVFDNVRFVPGIRSYPVHECCELGFVIKIPGPVRLDSIAAEKSRHF